MNLKSEKLINQFNQLFRICGLIALMLLIAIIPVLAQGSSNSKVVTDSYLVYLGEITTICWIISAFIAGYVFSIIFSAIFANAGYPPNVARLSCWLGSVLAFSLISFVIFGVIIPATLPIWLLFSFAIFLLLFGIIMFLTRKISTI